MKTISILHNETIEKISDFMDRMPGLVSIAVMSIIVVALIG